MALTHDQITSITRKFFLKNFTQLVFDQNLLQKRLAAKGTKPSSGSTIMQPFLHQGSGGGAYPPYGVHSMANIDQNTAAEFNWKYYNVPIVISRADLLMNDGPEGVFKLMKIKMDAAAMTMSDNLATDMFKITTAAGTDSSIEINSLDTMLNDVADGLSTGLVYGGITKGAATNTFWAGKTSDFGGAGLGPIYSRINSFFMEIADGNILPTIVVMHNVAFGAYINNQQPQQQYMKQSEMDAGFLTATFNGRTVSADLHVSYHAVTDALNRLYVLNEKFIDFVTHSKENNRLEPFQKIVDQNVIAGQVYWAGELTSSDPSRSGVAHNFEAADIT